MCLKSVVGGHFHSEARSFPVVRIPRMWRGLDETVGSRLGRNRCRAFFIACIEEVAENSIRSNDRSSKKRIWISYQ